MIKYLSSSWYVMNMGISPSPAKKNLSQKKAKFQERNGMKSVGKKEIKQAQAKRTHWKKKKKALENRFRIFVTKAQEKEEAIILYKEENLQENKENKPVL